MSRPIVFNANQTCIQANCPRAAAGLANRACVAHRMILRFRDTLRRALASAGLRRMKPALRPDDTVHDFDGTVKARPGQFAERSYSNPAGTRAYKVYVPRNYGRARVPLLVMLHGCTQNPDDFAAGTHMNELADLDGFLVVYPAQLAAANGANCWNWFHERDQMRDRGEPSLIAGITREVAATYGVDGERIYVAGLSAGAAMAVILGATYPDLFAAVGAHSGLPYGAAHNVPSAFAAMQGRGTAAFGKPSLGRRPGHPVAPVRSIPTIVFHGDSDTTVNAINGSRIVEQALALAADHRGALKKSVQARSAANGREYTTTIYRSPRKIAVIEHWVLHGAGHAWSGGSPEGTYTDATGPDASAEMVRFFLSQTASA